MISMWSIMLSGIVFRSTKPCRVSVERLPLPDWTARRPSTSTRVEAEPRPRRLTPETPVCAGGASEAPSTKLNAGEVVSVRWPNSGLSSFGALPRPEAMPE